MLGTLKVSLSSNPRSLHPKDWLIPLYVLGQAYELALRIGEEVLEEIGAVRLETLGADEGIVPLRSEPGVNRDAVNEAALPAPELDRQLSLLLESSGMKAQQATIAGLGQ